MAKKCVSCWFEDDVIDQIDILATVEHRSRSSTIRAIVMDAIDTGEKNRFEGDDDDGE